MGTIRAHFVRPDAHPCAAVFVAARTFEDSSGVAWEVFEVHRTSHKAEAVSPGLERGWLAFVSGAGKRRLAPFPAEWEQADSAELERLCGLARAARVTGSGIGAGIGAGAPRAPDDGESAPKPRVPRIRRTRPLQAVPDVDTSPITLPATSEDAVEQTVRSFAHQARARRRPAIEAMVELKGLLARVYPDPGSEARDVRAVRRWFVEAYYFERERVVADDADQSL
jgi:hypothetical protein